MITIKDIAEMANVSPSTVSRALNDSGYVGDETRKRILKIVEKTGYQPSEHAKSLRTKRTKVIGVVVPTIHTDTSSKVVSGLDEELAKRGYQILLANTNLNKEKEIEYIQLLRLRQVDGIVILATNVSAKLVETIQSLNIPTVVMGQEIEGVTNVLYDDYHAAKDMTSYLINKGHERISFIGVDESDRAVGYLRKKGFLDTMNSHGFTVEPYWLQQGIFDVESGAEAMRNILNYAHQPPTAVFAVTNRLAIGALTYLKHHGIKIPDQVAVASIGASEISKYVEPSLTTIDYENAQAGREAAKELLNQINKDHEPRKIVLGYRLIEKDSV